MKEEVIQYHELLSVRKELRGEGELNGYERSVWEQLKVYDIDKRDFSFSQACYSPIFQYLCTSRIREV